MPRCIICDYCDELPDELPYSREVKNIKNKVYYYRDTIDKDTIEPYCLECRGSIDEISYEWEVIDDEGNSYGS